LRDEPFLIGHFKAIDLDNLEFGKPFIRVFLKCNEENEESFSIETFTEIGIWNDIPVHQEGEEIPHPIVQHIPGLILDHMPDDIQFQRVVTEDFIDNLRSNYVRVYIAHQRHYIEGNLPFPEGMGRPFYVGTKFVGDESGNLVEVPLDPDEFPMSDQQAIFQFSVHGVKGTSQASRLSTSLLNDGHHLTNMLSYLFFRLEIRNRISIELEKLSFKQNVGRDKFSFSFFCPYDLLGVFFNEPVFDGMHFTSEPVDGSRPREKHSISRKNLHA